MYHAKRNLAVWQFAGFAAVTFLGTLLHFVYDRTGGNVVAALFSGVNESTWEHMKLLFFPLLLFAVVQYFGIGKELEGFWCIKLLGTLWGILLIPTLFYTLRGIFGTTPDWINIGIFFLSAAGALALELFLFKKGITWCKFDKCALIFLLLIALAFWLFTFLPPAIPLFQDPTDGSFGMPK